MKANNTSFLTKLFVIQYLVTLCVAKRPFDFFYFVQQWPGSYCDTRKSCCFPKSGKPAEDFGIHGLWPNYNDGTYPSNCDSNNPFDESKIIFRKQLPKSGIQGILGKQISDLEHIMQKEWSTLACPSGDGMKFWGHEWDKHGTCSESTLDQHSYFEKALQLKEKANLLQTLTASGIKPTGGFYTLENIKQAIGDGIGFTPYIECNVDATGNHQLYQVYLCVDKSGSDFIECPVMPHGRGCGSKIEFPSFSDNSIDYL